MVLADCWDSADELRDVAAAAKLRGGIETHEEADDEVAIETIHMVGG